MDEEGTDRPGRQVGAGVVKHGPGWISAFTAVAALVIGLLGGGAGARYVIPGPTSSVTITVTRTPAATGSPGGAATSAPNGVACPDGALAGALEPRLQRGWRLSWTGCRAIDEVGIELTDAAPEQAGADGSYTLAYDAPGDGWKYESPHLFGRWNPGVPPGPSVCRTRLDADEAPDADATRAHPADAYCYEEPTDDGATRVAFVQVYRVTASKVVARLWVWRSRP